MATISNGGKVGANVESVTLPLIPSKLDAIEESLVELNRLTNVMDQSLDKLLPSDCVEAISSTSKDLPDDSLVERINAIYNSLNAIIVKANVNNNRIAYVVG